MLSSDDYFDFECAVEDILDECFIGVNPANIPENATLATDGYTKLTEDKTYFFTEDVKKYKEQLISICNSLPLYPPVHQDSCATIAYADLLPNNISTKHYLIKFCELADEFFALLEMNSMGVTDELFLSKYGFKLFGIDKA